MPFEFHCEKTPKSVDHLRVVIMEHPWAAIWVKDKELGKGGQGTTYLVHSANDPAIQGALKTLNEGQKIKARRRMRQEVENLRALAGEGGAVPRILADNTDQAEDVSIGLYVVMQFIPGVSLLDYVRTSGRLSIDTAVKFALSLAKTIKVAHTFPIVHRDLKPDNILVRDPESHDLITVDYGISFNLSKQGVTEIGEQFKSSFLALPEMNTPSGNRRDPRSDVTALCGIIYFCLTGHIPGQLQDEAGRPPHLRPGYSIREAQDDRRIALIESMLTSGLTPNISNRFQEIDHLIESLEEILISSREFDASDPQQVAASIASNLRTSHRATQLAAFAKEADSLFQYVNSEFRKHSTNISPFSLNPQMPNLASMNASMGGHGRVKPKEFVRIPVGFELVSTTHWSIAVQVENHANELHCFFAVVAQGMQCILLAFEYSHIRQLGMLRMPEVSQSIISHEIARFERESDLIRPLVSDWAKKWLTTSMTKLGNEMLGSNR